MINDVNEEYYENNRSDDTDKKDCEELAMDGTSHAEISLKRNIRYSEEIIDEIENQLDYEELEGIKHEDIERYYETVEKTINYLWRRLEALTAHTDMFKVIILVHIGKMLNDVEFNMNDKSEYSKWINSKFYYQHIRYFQQAKQLANKESIAKSYASIGKNRLLELIRLEETGYSFEDIKNEYDLPDTAERQDITFFKERIDGIITHKRLIHNEVEIDYNDSHLLASIIHRPIQVKEAHNIKNWLEDFNENEKQDALDHLLLNKFTYPYHKKEAQRESAPRSFNSIFEEFTTNYNQVFERSKDTEELKDKIDPYLLKEAYKSLKNISEKLGIDLES